MTYLEETLKRTVRLAGIYSALCCPDGSEHIEDQMQQFGCDRRTAASMLLLKQLLTQEVSRHLAIGIDHHRARQNDGHIPMSELLNEIRT